MKTLLKWLIWLFAGLLVLATITVGIALFVFDSDNLKARATELVKEKTSANLTIGQDLSLKLFPWLKVESGDIRLSNPKGFSNNLNALEVAKLSASIKLMPLFKGQIEIGDIELDNSKLNLIRDRKGRSNIDVLLTHAKNSQPQAAGEAETDIANLSISRIVLNDFALNQYSPRGKLTQSFALAAFEINNFAFDQWTPIAATGEFKSGSGKTEAKWRLNSSVKVDAKGKKIELRSIDAVMSEISNKLKHLELSGNSTIDLNNQNTQVTHQGQLVVDKQSFELKLDGTFSTFKDINLQLNTDTLDLSPWLATTESENNPKADEPLDTKPIADFLKTARIKGQLQANQLTANKIALQQVSANLSNKGATLWLKPFKAKAFKGDLETIASINFAAKPLALSIQPTMQKIEVGELLSQFFELERLSGLGDLSLNMRTQGLGLKPMLQNLSGKGALNLSDGALMGLDLNKLIESGISLQLLEGKNAYKGKTTFASLKGDVNANKGLIQLKNLALQSPLFDLTGQASTDANDESLAGHFKLQLKGVLKQKLEQKYPQLAGMDLPFELKGSWAEPRPNIDFESLLKAKFKSKIDKQVEDKKKELEDELKKKLFDKIKF